MILEQDILEGSSKTLVGYFFNRINLTTTPHSRGPGRIILTGFLRIYGVIFEEKCTALKNRDNPLINTTADRI